GWRNPLVCQLDGRRGIRQNRQLPSGKPRWRHAPHGLRDRRSRHHVLAARVLPYPRMPCQRLYHWRWRGQSRFPAHVLLNAEAVTICYNFPLAIIAKACDTLTMLKTHLIDRHWALCRTVRPSTLGKRVNGVTKLAEWHKLHPMEQCEKCASELTRRAS